jgi:glucose-6-phosphate 1-dehydrogenase
MKTQLVIFGITGDLAGRKLLPALDSIIKTGDYNDLSIVGVSRREVDLGELLTDHKPLVGRTQLFTMDLADAAAYHRLKSFLEASGADQTLFYLSVPPGAAADIVDFLGQAGLNDPTYKVLFEKPFGYDLASAEAFIARTARYFNEDQLYRIDHYMAKEIAVQLRTLRQNAENHHHHWNNQSVKAITVVATESIGIEGRTQFYEQTGALRDFVQGHLLELLSLVLIQNPVSENLPAQRLKALEQLQPVDPKNATRAQYEGYQDEVANPGSQTETYVAFMTESNDPAWKGVPIRLVTGKALHEKRSYVSVEYTDGTEDVFDEETLTAQDGSHLDAYERVLLEAIAGRKDIFTSSPEVIRAWELLAPLQTDWGMNNESLAQYAPGSDVSAMSLHEHHG